MENVPNSLSGNTDMDSILFYQKRLNRVIDFISSHLSEPLSLAQLAEVAGFSSFHFHRIFTAITGETPADYVQRVRLELAVNYLVKTRRSITRIGFECGFKNSSDFARIFRRHYGLTPSQYRSSGKPYQAPIPEQLPMVESSRLLLEPPQFKHLAGMDMIYLAYYEGYKMEMICRLWERLSRWASLNQLDPSTTLALGISLDDPWITQHSKCRYYACLTIPQGTIVHEPFGSMHVPEFDYAVFHTACRPDEIQEIYHAIYRNWLPGSDYQPANSFPFEIYLQSPAEHPLGLFEMQVCIPIEPIKT